MTRFLREHAELITTVCVVLSLLLGGALLWLKQHSDSLESFASSTATPQTVEPVVSTPDNAASDAGPANTQP